MFVRANSGGGKGELESGFIPMSSDTAYRIKTDSLKSFMIYAFIDNHDTSNYYHYFRYNHITGKLYYDRNENSSAVSYSNGYITLSLTSTLGQCWNAYYMLYDYSEMT